VRGTASRTGKERFDFVFILVGGVAALQKPRPKAAANRAAFVLTHLPAVWPGRTCDVLVHVNGGLERPPARSKPWTPMLTAPSPRPHARNPLRSREFTRPGQIDRLNHAA
jgi:hypothetical protein